MLSKKGKPNIRLPFLEFDLNINIQYFELIYQLKLLFLFEE